MREIDTPKRSHGQHVVSWSKDGLDRILDDPGLYPGMCVHCYGRTGYDTYEGLDKNYGVILEEGHVHREMLKTFAYFAKTDGEGILVRNLMEKSPEDFELLYMRRVDKIPTVIDVGFFAYWNISFMSQMELPDGTLVSYPTTVYGMAGDAGTEREAMERFYDYIREKLVHVIGDHDDLANLFRPTPCPPHSPELGWIVHVGEAGSPSSSAVITGAFLALGLKP